MLSESQLSIEQLKAIGCLALESTRLEFFVEELIKYVCPPEAAEILLEKKMFSTKLSTLKKLIIRRIDSDLAARFNDLYEKICSDVAKRNAAIHGEWGSDKMMTLAEIAANAFLADKDAYAKHKSSTVKADEVIIIARRFSEYQKDLIDIWIALESQPRITPHKPIE